MSRAHVVAQGDGETAYSAVVLENSRKQGQDEVSSRPPTCPSTRKCDEEEWVEWLEELNMYGKHAKLKRWLCGVRKAACGWDDDYPRLLNDGVPTRQSSFDDILPSPDSRACRCSGRRLHVRSHGVGAGEDAIEDVRMVRRKGAWHSRQLKA